MKIVCSANLAYAEEAFSTLGETVIKDGRSITARDVKDADLLVIRSTTKVSADFLQNSSLKFVGTATIGTDHMDIPYMEEKGIKWCYAPGCNANSVAEYITAALLEMANKHHISLSGLTVGIIGVGNVGKLVMKKVHALGMNVLLNDPPRQRQQPTESGQRSAEPRFIELDWLLEHSDVVTMHVPLSMGGQDATYQMAGNEFFHKMRPGTIFINSARGAVMNTDALLGVMEEGIVSHAVIDTWENEPKIRTDILDHIDMGTPHIAGYSFDGKVAGTVMVYRQACEFLGVEPTWTPDTLLPLPEVPTVEIDPTGQQDEEALWNIVRSVYDIERDDSTLRKDPLGFDNMRRKYPVRREFRFTRVIAEGASENLRQKIAGIGFSL